MNIVLRLFLTLLFDSDRIFGIVKGALYILGAWLLLKKSGLDGWFSLIPGAREYQLSRCASREPEGRVYSLICVAMTTLEIITISVEWSNANATMKAAVPLILLLLITLNIMKLVYDIRIFSGFVEIYGLRKRWLFLAFLDETRIIMMLIWGISRKFQPNWKVEDLKAEMERLATEGSADVMDNGLTVNLKDRHVMEFFHRKYLLKDIHLAIPQGHMVLLLGGSGSGKTTLLNAINGYEKADAEVILNGSNMYTQYRKMLYEVGFVPQQETVRSKDTVESTLLDTAKLRLSVDIPAKERRKRVKEVMDIFGLTHAASHMVEKLSGGMRKRLSIAMELISNPALFILDEPDSGLDGVMARKLFVGLRKIADSGKIVIVITHTPDRVVDLFDDVIVLARDSSRIGRLAYYGSVDEARKFFGRERMEEIVKCINRVQEGGDGLADEFVMKYAEVQHG